MVNSRRFPYNSILCGFLTHRTLFRRAERAYAAFTVHRIFRCPRVCRCGISCTLRSPPEGIYMSPAPPGLRTACRRSRNNPTDPARCQSCRLRSTVVHPAQKKARIPTSGSSLRTFRLRQLRLGKASPKACSPDTPEQAPQPLRDPSRK